MLWALSAIAVFTVFASGTLGDRTMTSHRASTLDHVSGGRHRSSRREDVGGAHDSEVIRKDENTCMPHNEEHNRRIDALWCNEQYMRAVHEQIEKSSCIVFDPDYEYYGGIDTGPCAIFDERDDVNVSCSTECRYTVLQYLYCKYLGEERFSIDKECGMTLIGADFCSFNDKNFCDFINSSFAKETVYNECFVNDESCSDECKEAMEKFKDTQGCCLRYYFEYEYYEDMSLSDLFSTCGVEIPEACNSLPPPEKFLDCARDGDVHISPTVFYSIVVIMLSLLNVP